MPSIHRVLFMCQAKIWALLMEYLNPQSNPAILMILNLDVLNNLEKPVFKCELSDSKSAHS